MSGEKMFSEIEVDDAINTVGRIVELDLFKVLGMLTHLESKLWHDNSNRCYVELIQSDILESIEKLEQSEINKEFWKIENERKKSA